MKKRYFLDEIVNLKLKIDKKPCLIFLKGDLAAGKTTMSKHILNDILGINAEISSPTYTYYNKYGENFHFDLYRLQDYDEFFAIGGEEIFDNNSGVILVEWPELVEKYYSPDIEIILTKTENDLEREVEVIYN